MIFEYNFHYREMSCMTKLYYDFGLQALWIFLENNMSTPFRLIYDEIIVQLNFMDEFMFVLEYAIWSWMNWFLIDKIALENVEIFWHNCDSIKKMHLDDNLE